MRAVLEHVPDVVPVHEVVRPAEREGCVAAAEGRSRADHEVIRTELAHARIGTLGVSEHGIRVMRAREILGFAGRGFVGSIAAADCQSQTEERDQALQRKTHWITHRIGHHGQLAA